MIKNCNNCLRIYKDDRDFLSETCRWRMGPKNMLFFNCSCGSSLALPKAKFRFYSADINLTEDQLSLFNQFDLSQSLPAIRPNLYKIHFELQDEQANLPDVAALIKKEPVAAAALLELASSSARCDPSFKTIDHAVTYIGRKELGELALLADLKKLQIPCERFDLELFWQQSLTTGQIAKILACKTTNSDDQEIAYLSGCLANIGKIVMGLHNPKILDHIQRGITEAGATWVAQELALGVSHITLGEIAACFWGFPKVVISAIQHHHQLAVTRNLNGIISYAVQVAHVLYNETQLVDSHILSQGESIFELSPNYFRENLNLASSHISQKKHVG